MTVGTKAGDLSAFPIPTFQREDGYIDRGEGGMTKREYAAIQFAAGMLARSSYSLSQLRMCAFEYADKFLE